MIMMMMITLLKVAAVPFDFVVRGVAIAAVPARVDDADRAEIIALIVGMSVSAVVVVVGTVVVSVSERWVVIDGDIVGDLENGGRCPVAAVIVAEPKFRVDVKCMLGDFHWSSTG